MAAPTWTPGPDLPPLPSIDISGPEVVVYDASESGCAARDIPDLPARAFRDADGDLQLITGDMENRRLIGPSFDQLRHECDPVLSSSYDPAPSHYNFAEWLGATYTLDGETIHALVHMEYYGHQASGWDAERDFSSQQGDDNWRYEQRVGSSFRAMTFDPDADRWQGDRQFCEIRSRTAHPGAGCDAVRTWTSPMVAEISVSGRVEDLDASGGDGVHVEIMKGDQLLWSERIENGSEAVDFQLELAVNAGDVLRFIVSAGANTDFDTTYFSPVINLGEPPCPSGVPHRCQMMAITYARSDDGGETYTQPEPPAHLVAASPYRFAESDEFWGIWQPSNIIRNPQDGLYYVAVHVEDHAAQARGSCLIRTDRLDDPESWRAWDGSGFTVSFANPYSGDIDPLDHICQPVSADEIWTLTYSLTYNEYLEAFILLGHAVNVETPGFYYSLSRDLIHWTPRTLLMEADLVQTTDTPGRYLAYPSLIDPSSTARNFDVSGRRPYLFYSRFNDAPSGDVDLVRVQLEFTR